MNLKADVFARTKGAANTTKNETNIVLGKVEARSDLPAIFVQPLCCDVQFDALCPCVWECHSRF